VIYLLGLLARSGHGKTSVARHLVETLGAEIRSLAGPLKRAVQNVFEFSDAQLWGTQEQKETVDPRYGFSPRWLLQRLGTEGLRGEFGEDVHLRALLLQLRREMTERQSGADLPAAAEPRLYVVDDVRFSNDVRFIAEGGDGFTGAVLKIVATDVPTPAHGGHASEAEIDAVDPNAIAATILSSRAQGVAHLISEVDQALRTVPALAPLRSTLARRG